MKRLAIKAENISKQYRLGQIGTGTLSHDLNRFWHKLRGKPDPYLRIGEANDRSKKGDSDYVWSLKDINFEIEQGDTVGIIGRNGAGKSTLLKILSKVTQPTTGSIKVNGRVASLLEVGTGFHPEMTGRENIYMNGAILGMRKKEIDRKLDEIIDFSGVERYIDTPVKRYSSGMYVRLAFAVAAHLESEILIVDEVLAVGDAEFQKKCLGKMGEVSKGEGRTVLFVSHDMGAISKLCNKSMLLDYGFITKFDYTNNTIKEFIKSKKFGKIEERICLKFDKFEINDLYLKSQFSDSKNELFQGDKINLRIILNSEFNLEKSFKINVEVKNSLGISVCCFGNEFQSKLIPIKYGRNVVSIDLGYCLFKNDIYDCNIFVESFGQTLYLIDLIQFEVKSSVVNNSNWLHYPNQSQHGYIALPINEITVTS